MPSSISTASTSTASTSLTPHLENKPSLACDPQIFAIAIFDSNGLLEQSATQCFNQADQWLEAAFTSIGLKKLLSVSLNHSSFQQAKIRTQHYTAWIGRRRNRYIALLTLPMSWPQEQALDRYLRGLSLAQLIALSQTQDSLTAA